MTLNPRLIFRWTAFLLAGGYCIRTLIFGGREELAGPFRFLTIWALFFAFFVFSRMMAIEEGSSDRRWDGFVSMTTVINTMVVFLYWRLYFADPNSVTTDGELGVWYLELYLHLLGPLLLVIDTIFIHRSYQRLGAAAAWLVGWGDCRLCGVVRVGAATVKHQPQRVINQRFALSVPEQSGICGPRGFLCIEPWCRYCFVTALRRYCVGFQAPISCASSPLSPLR